MAVRRPIGPASGVPSREGDLRALVLYKATGCMLNIILESKMEVPAWCVAHRPNAAAVVLRSGTESEMG